MTKRQKIAALKRLYKLACMDNVKYTTIAGYTHNSHAHGLCALLVSTRYWAIRPFNEIEKEFLLEELGEQVRTHCGWRCGYLYASGKYWDLRAQFVADLIVAYEMGVL